MKISIVTTLYYSSEHILEFYENSCNEVKKLTDDYEIIFVNDGSPDNSLEKAISISKSDIKVKVIDLSRNFGHHKALMTGLKYASGDYVFLIDSDLEEDLAWLNLFWQKMQINHCDVVYGVQDIRKGGFFERISGHLYYKILNTILDIDHPENITTARLMTKDYVNALLLHEEQSIIFTCLCIITGFDQYAQIVNKRSSSKSTYTILKKISLLTNVVTSFSVKPLIFIFLSGIIIFWGSIIYTIYLVINKIYFTPYPGWTSLLASIWILGGIVISNIGILGIYLSKIYIETKSRPYTIIKKVYGIK